MEKLYKRKKDEKIFELMYCKPFILNSEIKETCSKFGISFDIFVLRADDEEIEIEMYTKINERFEEVEEEKQLGTFMLKEIEQLLGYDNNKLILDFEYKKSTIKFDNEIARVIMPGRVYSLSVDYENVITIIYYSDFINKMDTKDLANDKEIKNYIVMFDEPETALHISSIHKLIKMFKDMSKDNQLIIATHHPTIMLAFGEVYDLEKKKYVKAEKYLKQYEY